jgi:hypothetical protein
MKESDAVCLQADASVGVRARCAVFQVAFYGAADMRELAAYLVVPSREEFHFQEMVPFRVGDMAVTQSGQFGLRSGLSGYETLVQAFIALHPVFQQAFFFGRCRAAKGKVCLVNLPVAKHGVQPFKGFGCLGEDAKPAYGPVQAVRDSQENVSRFGVAFLDKGFEYVGEGSVAGLVALHYFSGLLVEYKQVVVFVNYAGGDVGVVHVGAKIMTICQFSPGGTAFVIEKSVASG